MPIEKLYEYKTLFDSQSKNGFIDKSAIKIIAHKKIELILFG